MERHKHKVLATLRKDGSPRVSGTESQFRDGELWTGSMPNARKAHDLRRDPRMAIHTTSHDTDAANASAWEGDVKLSGLATEIHDEQIRESFNLPSPRSHLFRIDLTEVTWTHVDQDELVIDTWQPGNPARQLRRK